jgi:hypothetical protein
LRILLSISDCEKERSLKKRPEEDGGRVVGEERIGEREEFVNWRGGI